MSVWYPNICTIQSPDGYVTVDIVLTDLETGYNFNTTLYAGHLGHDIVDDGFGLKPKLGWMLALVGAKKIEPSDSGAVRMNMSDVTHLKRKNEIDERSKMKPMKKRRRTELELLLNN